MEWQGWWSGEAVAEIAGSDGGSAAWLFLAYLILGVAFCLFVMDRAMRRSFWCPGSRRDVEVEFEARGLPGLRRIVGVKACSVFDPPTGVHCDRRCLDPDFRRLSAAGLPESMKLRD